MVIRGEAGYSTIPLRFLFWLKFNPECRGRAEDLQQLLPLVVENSLRAFPDAERVHDNPAADGVPNCVLAIEPAVHGMTLPNIHSLPHAAYSTTNTGVSG